MPFYTDEMSSVLSADVLAGVYQLIAGDRDSLGNHPSLMKVPAPPGSIVVSVPEVDFFGIALLSSQTNQEDAVSDTDVTDSQSQVSLTRWSKRHDVSDLFRNVDASGLSREEIFAMDAVMSLGGTIRDEHAKLADDFSSTQGGGAGVDATFENLLDCVGTLEVAEVPGPYLAMLHPLQWDQIRKDMLLNSGGAIQMADAPQQVLRANKGLGYQGDPIGGLTVYTTTSVVETGGAKGGGVFARGAIVHAISRPVADPDYPSVVLGDLLFERQRIQSEGQTAYVSHAFMGFIEGLDNKGVTLNSDN